MINSSSVRSKVIQLSLEAILTVEKIFVQLKKETVDKIKEVPLIKHEFNEKLSKMHQHKDHNGAPNPSK